MCADVSTGKVYQIVKAVVEASRIPVTVKIRKGWDEKSVNAVEIAQIIEEAGGCAVTVHGHCPAATLFRHSRLGYYKKGQTGCFNTGYRQQGHFTPEDAKQMLDETGCFGVMVGRGAQGNPWLFRRITHYLATGEILPNPSPRERILMALRHMDMMIDYKGVETGIREMRKHISWYLKGLPNANRIKNAINSFTGIDAIHGLLNSYLVQLEKDDSEPLCNYKYQL